MGCLLFLKYHLNLIFSSSKALLDDNDAIQVVKSDLVSLIETASSSSKKKVLFFFFAAIKRE